MSYVQNQAAPLWLRSAGIFRWNCDNPPSPAPGTMSSEGLRKLPMKVGTILQLIHASAPPTYLFKHLIKSSLCCFYVFLCNTAQSAMTFLSGFYSGGYYHGKLIFPREFPFKPPSIYMITPNGRFKCNTRWDWTFVSWLVDCIFFIMFVFGGFFVFVFFKCF